MYKCSSDTAYCVQSEMELLLSTSEMQFAASIMGTDLDEIHDNMDGDILANFSRQYHIWYDQVATPIQKSLIGHYFIHNSHHQLNDLGSVIAHRLVDSYALSREVALPYTSQKNKLIKIDGSLSNLDSRKNILNCIKNDEKLKFFLSMFYGKLAVYTHNITHTLSEVAYYYYNTIEKPRIDAVMSNFRGPTAVLGDVIDDTCFRVKIENNKKNVKGIRRIFNKSVNGLKSFLGSSNTHAFINGDEVKVEGNLFDYVLKKSMSLIKYTETMDSFHIPYSLSIHAKDGRYITKLCVIFPGCPILDQVLSLYLMIKSGKEIELLQTGNFYGDRGDAYYTDATFQKMFDIKFKTKPESILPSVRTDETDINVIGAFFSLSMGNGSEHLNDALTRSNTIKKEIEYRHPNLKQKVMDLLLYSTGLSHGVKEALQRQELSWDEMIDYVSIGIALPTYIDSVVGIKTSVANFNSLHRMVEYDMVENRSRAMESAPKKILQLLD